MAQSRRSRARGAKAQGSKGQGSKGQGAKAPGVRSGRPGTRTTRTTPRYTPPTPKTKKRSPLWVPVTMFTCMLAGLVVVVANYLQLLPGGEAKNSFLFLGLGLIVAGFGLSTQYR